MRIACLDLPALPLQLAWRAMPAWRALPVVVIERDKPHAEVLWACEKARAKGVLPGHRFRHALSLCEGLRARVVPEAQIAEACGELRGVLATLSPSVEADGTGTFWLDGTGLARLYDDRVARWGAAIARAVDALGYRGAVVLGFSRFATYAIARVSRGVVTLTNDAEERARATAVPLARIDIEPRVRDELARLAITRVGEFARLPGGGILERFGPRAHRLYQLAARERWDPVAAAAPPETPDERVLLDEEDDNVDRLLFVCRPPVTRLVARLAARHHAIVGMHVELTLKHGVGKVSLRVDCIKPASATLDAALLLRLLHLRLSGVPPEAPVNAVRVWADEVPANHEQIALFSKQTRPRRDLSACEQALAQLRAELGNEAVVCAELLDSHIPEASYAWRPLGKLRVARPQPRAIPSLIRRIFTVARMVASRKPRSHEDGWLLSGIEQGAVTRIRGPYTLTNGWWGEPLHRDYHYARLARGGPVWMYFDKLRNRWFWQGRV